MSPSLPFFTSVLGNDFGNAAKYHGREFGIEVVLPKHHNSSIKAVDSVRSSGAGVTDTAEIKRRLHGVDLRHESGSDLIAVKAVVIQNDSFPILYPYVFHCTAMNDWLETLGHASNDRFYVQDSQAMRAIDKNQRIFIEAKIQSRPKASRGPD